MKHYLALLCIGALAACGVGGGGGSTPTTQATPTNTSNQTSSTAANPQNTSGKQFYSSHNSKADAVTFDNSNIKKIKVDGVDIDLATVGGGTFNGVWRASLGSPSVFMPASVNNYAVYNQSDNLVAGTISKNGNDYAFYNGKFTDVAQIPVSGQSVYNASVVQFKGSSQSFGSTRLTADFGAKKVTGDISRRADDGGNIAINADIKGNKFASATGAPTQVEGGFFGANAAEIGGIFKSGETVGAFAGKK